MIQGNVTPKWAKVAISIPGAANLLNVMGIITGELRSSWKALFDSTVPSAVGTASAGTGTIAARVNHVHAGKVTRHILFRKTGSLTQNVPLAPFRVCVGEAGEHGTLTAIRAKAACTTVGAGTNTIQIQADNDPAFPSPVVLFTIALDTALEADDTTLDNAWDVAGGDIWVRALPSAVNGGTAPQDVEVDFTITEAVW
jgi:hypothetical protein